MTVHDPMEQTNQASTQREVDLLILGAGWTSTFLIPLLNKEKVTHAQTSTTGREGTIKFKFDPEDDSTEQYAYLPTAKTILITFPLTGHGQSKKLTLAYLSTHGKIGATSGAPIQWIQLGSTGIFAAPTWNTSDSPYNKEDARAIAEDELREVVNGSVLNLAGLYDGDKRDIKSIAARLFKNKQQVRDKGALHMIHGVDVARAILAVHRKFTFGKRWLVADTHSYDWWDLIQDWGPLVRRAAVERGITDEKGAADLEFERWVGELMIEKDVRALPRSHDLLGRVLDSRDFWNDVGVWPVMGRVK